MPMPISVNTILADLRSFVPLWRAIRKGQYKMPWATCFWAVLCVVYFLSPIDTLPDIIPILGFADDGAFALFVLLRIHQELQSFRLTQQPPTTIIEAEVTNEEKHD